MIEIIALLLLFVITYQDFKSKAIWWWTAPLLTVLLLAAKSFEAGIFNSLVNMGVNLLFVGLQLAIVTAYFSLKNRKLLNVIGSYIGWGDILFFIAAAAWFSPVQYILFYVFSLLIILLGVFIYNNATQYTVKRIPLAGGMAGVLSLLIIFAHFGPIKIPLVTQAF